MEMYGMRLEGKRALITGGAAGIGEAIVRLFAQEGASILIADVGEEKGNSLAHELFKSGFKVAFKKTDVSSSISYQEAIKDAVELYGGLDILVNDAGIVEQDVMLEDETVEEWKRVLGVNLHGTFYGCKYALPYLRKSRGCIVNIASMSGLVATRYCAAYCASKAAVIGLTRALAADYAPYGVRVNAICPAACETPMMKNYFSAFSKEEVEEKIARLSGPVGRMCQPLEIANAVLFLASGESSYTSGLAMPVDGGYTAV